MLSRRTQHTRSGIERLPAVKAMIRRALDEDIGPGDATTLALVSARRRADAVIFARQPVVVAGASVAAAVFKAVDPGISTRVCVRDGLRARAGQPILRLRGRAAALLAAERAALNFVQRMSGIATLTAKVVAAVKGTGTIILDTRKTAPGLRVLDKYAVACGGGQNHRFGLYDRVLIKDNHRKLWKHESGASLADAVAAARARFPRLPIEIEVESEAELRDALRAKPDWVLLDNMEPALMRRCVQLCAGRCRVEASGGITLENVHAVAKTGVDAISLGFLTHSVPAADLSLEFGD